MKRTPGKKEDKVDYLKDLNQYELPFLIADILASKYGHHDILILDGPGDGRRDIQSIHDGSKYLVQCKFHGDRSKTSGSRELDEIIIALAKFDITHGVFATNGKISPQAKREYLDNYPQYTLDFIEGVNIVEIVLSDKVLRRLWIDGEKLGQVLNRIVFPFSLRNLSNNSELKIDSILGIDFDDKQPNVTIEIGQAYEYIGQLEPYSEPAEGFPFLMENRLDIYSMTISGPINFTSYSLYVEILVKKLIVLKVFAEHVVAIRFGRPYFEDLSEKTSFKRKDKFGLPDPPITIIINGDDWVTEQSFYVDTPNTWRDPKLIQMSGVANYGRYNEKADIICYVEYQGKIDLPKVSFHKQRKAVTEILLARSLSLFGLSGNIDKFKKQDFHYPFIEYKYGPGGSLLFWEYPTNHSYSLDAVEFENELTIEDFEEFKRQVLDVSRDAELTQANLKELLLVLQLNGIDPINSESIIRFRYVDLLESFDDIPSPAFPNQRLVSFEVVWSIDKIGYNNSSAFLDTIRSTTGTMENVGCQEILFGYDDDNSELDFVNARFYYKAEAPISTVDLIMSCQQRLFNHVDAVESIIKSKKPETKRNTSKYWYYELGIKL